MADMPVTPLVVQLRRMAQSIVDELVERMQAAGYTDITTAHHPVFYNLDLFGTRLTELAARAGMTHQSMGELVSALVELGYLERVPDPVDRRARLVVLTRRGRKAVRLARAEVADIDARWVERLRRAGVETDIRKAFTTALAERG
jgi:DNA-binding MarR family transcriptional regulator